MSSTTTTPATSPRLDHSVHPVRHLDARHIQRSFGGAIGLFFDMVAAFPDSSNDALLQMERALSARDWTQLHFAAHALLDTVGVFSSGEIERLTSELQSIGESGHSHDAPQILAVLKQSIAELESELRLVAALVRPSASRAFPPVLHNVYAESQESARCEF